MNHCRMAILDKIENIAYLTQPSGVVLVSTVDKQGTRNLAPYGMYMPCSVEPPRLALGILPSSDTFRNIVDTEQFVVGVPSELIVPQIYQAGSPYKEDVDEFLETGLTSYSSTLVTPPCIHECIVNMECQLFLHQEVGDHFVVVGSVVAADIDSEVYSSDPVVLRSALPRVYHVTGPNFVVNGKPMCVTDICKELHEC